MNVRSVLDPRMYFCVEVEMVLETGEFVARCVQRGSLWPAGLDDVATVGRGGTKEGALRELLAIVRRHVAADRPKASTSVVKLG